MKEVDKSRLKIVSFEAYAEIVSKLRNVRERQKKGEREANSRSK